MGKQTRNKELSLSNPSLDCPHASMENNDGPTIHVFMKEPRLGISTIKKASTAMH